MKLFTRNLLFFVAIVITYFTINYILNRIIIETSSPDIEYTNIFIAGDSHLQKAVNPSLFNSAVTIAQPAEPYIVTYWRLRYLFKFGTPDTLLLGFGHHNISSSNDLKFSDSRLASEMFSRIYPIQDFRNLEEIQVDYWEFVYVVFHQMCFYPKNDHMLFPTIYQNVDNGNLADLDTTISLHYPLEKENSRVSKVAIQYIDSIVGLCEKHGVKIALIGSPVHADYFEKIPVQIRNKYNETILSLKKRDILVLNYTNLSFPDNHFLDNDHLNISGANKFSRILKNDF